MESTQLHLNLNFKTVPAMSSWLVSRTDIQFICKGVGVIAVRETFWFEMFGPCSISVYTSKWNERLSYHWLVFNRYVHAYELNKYYTQDHCINKEDNSEDDNKSKLCILNQY